MAVVLEGKRGDSFEDGIFYHLTNRGMWVEAIPLFEDEDSSNVTGWVVRTRFGDVIYEDFRTMRNHLAEMDGVETAEIIRE